MKRTFPMLLIALFCLFVTNVFVFCARAEDAPAVQVTWLTDHAQAIAASKESGKPVLMLFTGTDWCPPCQHMEKTVFSTAEFATWARQNVVLLKLDFLKHSPQVEAIRKQNDQLAARYKQNGFPTMLIIDASGKDHGRLVGGKNLKQFMNQIQPIVVKAKG